MGLSSYHLFYATAVISHTCPESENTFCQTNPRVKLPTLAPENVRTVVVFEHHLAFVEALGMELHYVNLQKKKKKRLGLSHAFN